MTAHPRFIPCLLLKNKGLVKTQRFKNPSYVGDPINAVKIFCEKEVDELVLLDIYATRDRVSPDIEMIQEIVAEAFMPICYGGGICELAQAEAILKAGVEKICLNTAAIEAPFLVQDAARAFGSQSVVVSIDYRNSFWGGNRVYCRNGSRKTKHAVLEHAMRMQELGAGEIFLNSIERDGMMNGYDLELIREVASKLSIPLIACGGAGGVHDLVKAVTVGEAAAAAAGSLFVYHGPHRAVLITYPERSVIESEMAAQQEPLRESK